MGSPVMQFWRWMRVPGDTIFALGALVLVFFVFAHHKDHTSRQPTGEVEGLRGTALGD